MTSSSIPTPSHTEAIDFAPTATELGRRLERLIPLVLVIAVFLVAMLSITPWPVGAYEDDAIYTLLGKALATGEGYRMINLPGAPHATHYPPGYPFLVSLLWRIWPEFPDNVVVFKFANAMLLGVATGGAFWFARIRLGYSAIAAALVALVATASIPMLQLAGLVLSEPLFVAMLFLVVLAVERSARSGTLIDAALAGALLGALCLVRTIGVVAIGAAITVLVFRRQLKAAAVVIAVAALFLVPWQMWVDAHQSELAPILNGKYGPYVSWVIDGYREGGTEFARHVVVGNLASMANTLSYIVMPASVFWLRLLSLAVLLMTVAGGLIVLVRRSPVLALFCLFYLGLLVVWPFDPYRFLLALWPVVVIAGAECMRAIWTWRATDGARRTLRFAALGAGVFLVGGHAAYNWNEFRTRSWVDLQRRAGISARPLVEWVHANTQPGDVLSTEHDVVVYLYTGRRGTPTSTFLPSQRMKAFTPAENAYWVGTMVRTFEPRYLVTGWPAHIAAADTLGAGPSPLLRRVGTIPNHKIYERVPQE